MSLHLRIQTKLKEKGLRVADLARATGVSPVAAGKWFHGTSEPKAATLKDIAKFLDVTDDWLLTGASPPTGYTAIKPWDDKTPLDDDEVEIPFFEDFSFACGSGAIGEAIANETRKLRVAKSTLRNLSITKENAIAASASGDSMVPSIHDGDTVHVDLGRKTIKDGRIFAICIGGLNYSKRLYNMPLGGVRIVSDNSHEFPEIILSAEQIIEQQFDVIGWVWQVSRIEKW